MVEKNYQGDNKDQVKETLIFGPVAVVAKDDKMAAVNAVAQAKDKLPSDLSNVEVLVRPFISR